jgi:predicted Ser/Thr protein kinase
MSEIRKCPECGAELPGAAEGDSRTVCVACLLKRGLESNTAGYTQENVAARWMPPDVQAVARRFPELEITRLIGRGGMGAVYEARQRNLDRVVALKILPPEMAGDAAFRERFAREAQAMARLNHPHIVTIYEFGERADEGGKAGGWYFFVMEFVDGMNLRGLLDSGHVSPNEALAIVPQICEALQYAHDRGIVHRDIKPENILLNKQGQVKIADFGLAKLMGRGAGGTPAHGGAEKVMGTPQYMAPEQMQRPAEVDHRADIYSLGVVFYQLLTGELPVGRFAAPSKKVQVDVRLDEVVLKALEREPEKRYQQVSEVKTEVETIAGTPAEAPHFHAGLQEGGGPRAPHGNAGAGGRASGDAKRENVDWWLIWLLRGIYVFAALLAVLPFFVVGIDPGDRGHLARFIAFPLVALGIVVVGKFLWLVGCFLIVHLGRPNPSEFVRPLRGRWVIAGMLVFAVAAYAGGAAAGRLWTEGGRHVSHLASPFSESPALMSPSPSEPRFGPVVELSPRIFYYDEVPQDASALAECSINFHAGQLVAVPRDLASKVKATHPDPAVVKWASQAIHAVVLNYDGDVYLWSTGMGFLAAPCDNGLWQQVTARELQARIRGGCLEAGPDDDQMMNPKGHFPATFLFRTGEGEDGILQVLGSDDQRMKIRYKLVQLPAEPALTAPSRVGRPL